MLRTDELHMASLWMTSALKDRIPCITPSQHLPPFAISPLQPTIQRSIYGMSPIYYWNLVLSLPSHIKRGAISHQTDEIVVLNCNNSRCFILLELRREAHFEYPIAASAIQGFSCCTSPRDPVISPMPTSWTTRVPRASTSKHQQVLGFV